MTAEDAVYAGWLNLLGSDEITDPDESVREALHRLHDLAGRSHEETAV